MNNAFVATNLEAPQQNAVGRDRTGRSERKDGKPKQDFKEHLENCEYTEKPSVRFENLLGGGQLKQTDNSMSGNLEKIVGTLEGFGLLDYQSDNVEAITQELLNIFGIENISAEEESAFAQTLMNGIMNGSLQDETLAEQLAGMRPNEQLAMTQQDILERVGAYLCSLESTNNEPLSGESIISSQTLKFGESMEAGGFKMSASDEAKGEDTAAVSFGRFGAGPGNAARSIENAPAVSKAQEQGVDIARDNILRIVDKVSTHAAEGKHDFDIQLKPDFLGKLNIKLTMDNGSLKVQIKAHDSAARTLVTDNLSGLQSTLEERGIDVANIDILYNGEAFADSQDQAFEQESGNRKMHKGRLNLDIADVSAYEPMMYMPEVYLEGSSVEFHA